MAWPALAVCLSVAFASPSQAAVVQPPTNAALAEATQGAVSPPGQSESLLDYFYGSSAIPSGTYIDRVYNRFILATSVVFVEVDTTSWPQADLSLPGLVLAGQGDGFFDVKALTDTNAPPPGIPYSYVVFNARSTGPFIAGDDGAIPNGAYNGSVSNSAVKSTSEVFLTPRAIGESRRALPDVKVNNHGTGFFTVTTASNAIPSGGEHFNYLIVNEVGFSGGQFYSGCRQICGTAVLPQGHTNVGFSFAGVSAPAAIFVTEDITRLPADTALPGIKVNNHGAGFFTVTTAGLTPAPTTAAGGIPFNFLVFQPPHQWEEYGPTARSGNPWSVAADPSDALHTWYLGAIHGGVWKTTNAGDTWYQAWKDSAGASLPMIDVVYLSFSPMGHLFALSDDGRVYRSSDHALTWTRLPDVAVVLPTTGGPHGGGAFIVADANDNAYVCSDTGLRALINGAWQLVGVTSVSGQRCSHVLIDGSTIYAAFRGSGLYQLQSFGSWRLLKPATSDAEAPIRIAVNATKIVVNDDCNVWLRSKTDLTSSTVATTWGPPIVGTVDGKVCDLTAGGSSTTAAVSPDGTHLEAGGRGAWLSTDGGAATPTFPTHLFTVSVPGTGETRQFIMVDNTTFLAAVDGGLRLTHDGGQTWRESEHRFREIDGPPTTEFYDLGVSAPNQFGQVMVGGAVQDLGGVAALGRPTGVGCCTEEWGRVAIAAKPIDSSAPGDPTSTATMFGSGDEDGSDSGRVSHEVTACAFTTTMAPRTREATGQEGYYPFGSCTSTTAFVGDDTITIMATAPFATNALLVGGSQGAVVAGDPNSSTLKFKTILAPSADPVTALLVASQLYAYVGFQSGRVVRITDPFGQYHSDPVTVSGAPASAVNAIANRYGDANEIYLAYAKQLFVSTNGGTSWAPRLPAASSSPPLQPATIADALARSDLVGVVRDPDHPVVILAFGRKRAASAVYAYVPDDYAPGSLWTAAAPVASAATWTGLNEGLPPSTPITGIGLSPNKALFISTQGRGIWWRRDVISGLPNSGVNAPDQGTSRPGELVIFDTQCSYPGGWRHITTLEFKLAQGQGPGDDAPAALWVAVDTARNVIRLYNPVTRRWLEGPIGARLPLVTTYATVWLDRTHFEPLAGAEIPTVDIRWAVTLSGRAAGDLQQYLRVTDDQGNRTSWDRVGSWQVGAP